jgi:hypothetical protein
MANAILDVRILKMQRELRKRGRMNDEKLSEEDVDMIQSFVDQHVSSESTLFSH